MSEEPTEVQLFPRVEGFTITQMLSEKGGMADVYLANQHGNDRLVILKFLRENDPGYIKRFRKEARDQSKINHANVVTIYTVQEVDQRLYIAMEFMQGGDLSEVIKTGISEERITSTLISIASALQATHAVGIIHRDIKPENILFNAEGTAKLSDFGIARTLEGDGLTQANSCIGTPRYMSPEQLKGQQVDRRSDLYSLGLALYEMLTGKPPFEGSTLESIFFQKVNQPELKLPGDKQHWQTILNKLVEPNPDKRYQEAADLITDLNNMGRSTEASKAQGIKAPYLALVSVLLLLTGGGVYFGLSNPAQPKVVIDNPATETDSLKNVPTTQLGITSKLLVPYDQDDCQLNVAGGIDFVPYLGEPLYEDNCFGMSAKWNGAGAYYLISDVSGDGLWARMYPNECGNLGIPGDMPIDTKVFMPTRNKQPWFFKLDNNARSFQFISLAVKDTETSPEVIAQLAALPSICALSADSPKGNFDWKVLQESIEQQTITANIAYDAMLINHQQTP